MEKYRRSSVMTLKAHLKFKWDMEWRWETVRKNWQYIFAANAPNMDFMNIINSIHRELKVDFSRRTMCSNNGGLFVH